MKWNWNSFLFAYAYDKFPKPKFGFNRLRYYSLAVLVRIHVCIESHPTICLELSCHSKHHRVKCKNEKGIRKIWRAFWRENRKKNMFLYFLWEKAFSCHFGWLVSQSVVLTLSWGVCLRKSRASKIFTLCFISDMVWSEKKSLKIFSQWESCRSSATYDLWLKAESWSLNFKILKKNH